MVKQGEARKYKHIYFHKLSKTWSTVRKGYPTVGHLNQDTAAMRAAKAWGVTRASLKMPETGETVDTVPTQRYRHVTWHCGKKVWVAQGGTGTQSRYLGCSANQEEALHIACSALQCKPEDLELQAGRRACSTSSDTCQRMAVMMRVYKGKKRTEPMVPADIAHLMRRARSDRVCFMHSETGQGMMFPYIISKFPDHRDKIAGVSSVSDGKCTEASLYQALLRVSREISGKKLPAAQVRNVGRKCMHHGSFVMFASKGLKMLRLVQKNVASPGRERLQFGKGSIYAVSPLNKTMKRKLLGLMAFGKALAASKPPRTLADWRVEMDRLTSVIRSPPAVPGCTGVYRRSWAIRCGLIFKMRQHGVASLKVEQGDSVRDFLGNFPDQKSQVLAMAGGKHQQHRLMLDIFNECGYKLAKNKQGERDRERQRERDAVRHK
jgi:hypothetical protein